MATELELEALRSKQSRYRGYGRKYRNRDVDAGICVWRRCHEQAAEGRRMCEKHLDARAAEAKAYREQLERDEAALRMKPYSLPVKTA